MLKRWQRRILLFLAVLGPGFITANVDNDAGGILTYSGAGAQFGYSLLWTILPITVALIVVQEMCARMGVVTGKGLSDLIREEFGLRATFITMVLLLIVNFGLVVTEFIGIAGSMELFHISKYISVPVCAVLVWLLVVRGDYKSVEKVFLAASVFYIAYIITGVLSGPSWREAMLATVKLPPAGVWHTPGYISMTIAVIGTTIAPWMQFYLQSSVVEKGVAVKDYAASRLDVIVGSIFTDVVAWFIVVACAATLYAHGVGPLNVPSDAAEAMKPLAKEYAYLLFAIGLFNASFFAASVLYRFRYTFWSSNCSTRWPRTVGLCRRSTNKAPELCIPNKLEASAPIPVGMPFPTRAAMRAAGPPDWSGGMIRESDWYCLGMHNTRTMLASRETSAARNTTLRFSHSSVSRGTHAGDQSTSEATCRASSRVTSCSCKVAISGASIQE